MINRAREGKTEEDAELGVEGEVGAVEAEVGAIADLSAPQRRPPHCPLSARWPQSSY